MSDLIVTQSHIKSILTNTKFDVETKHGKTTIVTAKLPNEFVIVESTGCVDPANYDESIGVEICKKRIEDKIWYLEGYLLQDRIAERNRKAEIDYESTTAHTDAILNEN